MQNNIKSNLYETDNLGIAAYLALNGLSFVEARSIQGRNLKKKISFIFDDPAGVGFDMAQDYINSREKKFRDFLFLFRNKIEEILKVSPGVR